MKIIRAIIPFDLVVITALLANIFHTHSEVMNTANLHVIIYPTHHIFFILTDIFIIYLISLVFLKHRYLALLLLYFCATFFMWSNVMYSRYFETYLPISLLGHFENLNGLIPNIVDAISLNDLFFVYTSIIVVVIYVLQKTNNYQLSKYLLSLLFTLLCVTFFIHYKDVKYEQHLMHDFFKEQNDNRTTLEMMVYRMQAMEHSDLKTCTFYYGLITSPILRGIINLTKTHNYSFSVEEKQMCEMHKYASNYEMPNNTIENIILILVESLSSYPINKIYNGKEITPNINKLLPKAYYNLNMESETQLGESSDGQLIYLTGLLPLKGKVTVNELSAEHVTSFVSIYKMANKELHTQMIIPTKKNYWMQQYMCKKYNIDSLFARENYLLQADEWLNDKQIFEFASSPETTPIKQPFVNIILTSSMHSPYDKSIEQYNIDYPVDFPDEVKHYLDNVHYMDKYLGIYLESIKNYSWYNQTSIVIVADHKPKISKLNYKNGKSFARIPLIIINPPFEYKERQDTQHIGQSAVFPTLLDILRIKSKWRGVGQSVFMPDSIKSTIYEHERDSIKQICSEYIIKTEYIK